MYYAKELDEQGNLIALHSMDRPFTVVDGIVPITEAEYLELLAEIEEPTEPDEISDSEALRIITGGDA